MTTFGTPDSNGVQHYTVKRYVGAAAVTASGDGMAVASGFTDNAKGKPQGRNGTMAFAGERSDPFFFDLIGFRGTLSLDPVTNQGLCSVGGDPDPDGTGTDFFAPLNTLAIVLEVPDAALGTNIGVWADTRQLIGGSWTIVDQMARPAINTVFNSGADKETFNVTPPSQQDDAGKPYRNNVKAVLPALGGYTEPTLTTLANALIPDVITYNTASMGTNILNGRALADDVIDAELQIVLQNPAASTACRGTTTRSPASRTWTTPSSRPMTGGRLRPPARCPSIEISPMTTLVHPIRLRLPMARGRHRDRPRRHLRGERPQPAAPGRRPDGSGRRSRAGAGSSRAPGWTDRRAARALRRRHPSVDRGPRGQRRQLPGGHEPRPDLRRPRPADRRPGRLPAGTRGRRPGAGGRFPPTSRRARCGPPCCSRSMTSRRRGTRRRPCGRPNRGAPGARGRGRCEPRARRPRPRPVGLPAPRRAGPIAADLEPPRPSRVHRGRPANGPSGWWKVRSRPGPSESCAGGSGLLRVPAGELHRSAGQLAEAEAAYEQALEMLPGHIPATAGLARIREAQGRRAEAITLLEAATARLPQPELVAALGDLYALAGDAAAAERQYALVERIGEVGHGRRDRSMTASWSCSPPTTIATSPPRSRPPRPPLRTAATSTRYRRAGLGPVQGRSPGRGSRGRRAGAGSRHPGSTAGVPRRDDRRRAR